MRKYAFIAPNALNDLFDQVAQKEDMEIRYLAGGTDLVVRMNVERDQIPYEEKKPMLIVSLAKLGLSGINDTGDAIKIGACTTIAELRENAVIRSRAAALAESCDQMAGYAIRNIATIGGNIMNASPAADTVPPLLALDAEVELTSAAGRRTVKLAAFVKGPGRTAIEPGEILTKIILFPGQGGSAFVRLGRRAAETLSVVNAAAYVETEGGMCTAARIAVGSCAPTVVVCEKAAAALVGRTLDKAAVEEAVKLVDGAITPIDDQRSTAWYRRQTAPVVSARAVARAAGVTE